MKQTFQRVGSPDIEICGIICDNQPAQIRGLSSFLSVKGGPGSGIMHVPCLNHMINLVFSYAIQCDPFVEVMNDLPDRRVTLRSKQSVEIIRSNCLGLFGRVGYIWSRS
jgi:hypothetical protein